MGWRPYINIVTESEQEKGYCLFKHKTHRFMQAKRPHGCSITVKQASSLDTTKEDTWEDQDVMWFAIVFLNEPLKISLYKKHFHFAQHRYNEFN